MEENEITGIDTIHGLVGEPPREIIISKKVVESGTSLMRVWNSLFLAFLPYCFKCKAPLNWYSPPTDYIFHCPSCGRKWRIE